MPMELRVSTMGTARRRSDQLRLDMKVVFSLIYRKNMVVYQSQNIQKARSLPKVLPHKFLFSRKIPVNQERRLPRLLRVSCVNPTHFYGFGLLCPV